MSKRKELKPEERGNPANREEVREVISKLKQQAASIIVDETFNPDRIEHVTRDNFDKKQLEVGGSKNRGKRQAISDRFQDRDFSKLVVAEVNLHNIKRQTLGFCQDLEKQLVRGDDFTAYDLAGLEDARTDLKALTTHHYEYQDYEHRRTRGELSKKEGAKHKLMGGATSEFVFTTSQIAAVGLVHTACQYGSRAAILHATASGVLKPSQSVKDAIQKLDETSSTESTEITMAEIATPSTLTGAVATTVLSDKNLDTVTEQLTTQTQAEMERVGVTNTTQLPESSIREIATSIAKTTVLPSLSKEDVTILLESGTSSTTPVEVPDNYDSLSIPERIAFLETLPDFAVSSSYLPNDAFPEGNNLIPTIADFLIAAIRNVTFTRLDFSYEAEKSKQKLEGKLNPKPKPTNPKLATFIDNFVKSAHRQVYYAPLMNVAMATVFGAIKAALDNDKDKDTQEKMNEFIQSVGVAGLWSIVTGIANASIDAGRSVVKLGNTGQQLLKILGRTGIRGLLQFGKGVALDGKDMTKAAIEALILGIGSGAGKELISASIILGKEKYALPVGKNPTFVGNYISTLAEIGTKHKSQPVVELVLQVAKTIPGNNTFEIVNPHRYETPEVMRPVYIQSPMLQPKALSQNLPAITNPEQLHKNRLEHLDYLKGNVLTSVTTDLEMTRQFSTTSDSGVDFPDVVTTDINRGTTSGTDLEGAVSAVTYSTDIDTGAAFGTDLDAPIKPNEAQLLAEQRILDAEIERIDKSLKKSDLTAENKKALKRNKKDLESKRSEIRRKRGQALTSPITSNSSEMSSPQIDIHDTKFLLNETKKANKMTKGQREKKRIARENRRTSTIPTDRPIDSISMADRRFLLQNLTEKKNALKKSITTASPHQVFQIQEKIDNLRDRISKLRVEGKKISELIPSKKSSTSASQQPSTSVDSRMSSSSPVTAKTGETVTAEIHPEPKRDNSKFKFSSVTRDSRVKKQSPKQSPKQRRTNKL